MCKVAANHSDSGGRNKIDLIVGQNLQATYDLPLTRLETDELVLLVCSVIEQYFPTVRIVYRLLESGSQKRIYLLRIPSQVHQFFLPKRGAKAKGPTYHAARESGYCAPSDKVYHADIPDHANTILKSSDSQAHDTSSNDAHSSSDETDAAVRAGGTRSERGYQNGFGTGQDTELYKGSI